MSCAFDKEKLTGYYDGELDSAEKADLERHISACSECLRELGEIKSAATLVKELPRRRAPRSIAEGVSREIAAAGRVHRFDRWRRGLLWGTAAAAALFVAVNIAYFAGAPPAAESPSPAAGLATSLKESQKADGTPPARQAADRNLVEVHGEPEKEDLKAKNETAQRELAKQVQENRRESERERAAARPAPATEPARPAAPGKESKLEEKEKKSEPPPAPPAAAPPPAALRSDAPVAKAAPKPEAGEKDKDAGKGAPLPHEGQLRRQAVAPAPVQWTIASLDVPRVRARIEELARKWSGPGEKADRAGGFADGRGGGPLTLELTKAQVDELRKEIEKQSGVSLAVGAPDDALTGRFLRGEAGGGAKKDAASAAPGAASKAPAPAAPPAKPSAGALAKGKDAKEGYDPKAEEARKQLAEAESRAKAKESPRDARALDDAALRKFDEQQKLQQGAAPPAGPSAGEPLQRVILHFLEVPK